MNFPVKIPKNIKVTLLKQNTGEVLVPIIIKESRMLKYIIHRVRKETKKHHFIFLDGMQTLQIIHSTSILRCSGRCWQDRRVDGEAMRLFYSGRAGVGTFDVAKNYKGG